MDTVQLAVDAGARAVVLREKDLDTAVREALGRQLREVLGPSSGLLIVASDVALAHRVAADGVHLAARDAFPLASSEAPALVGRSCHDSDELQKAASEACSYITLSPVFASASKAGYGPPLDAPGLAALARKAHPTLVFALGGITATNASACIQSGAHGVAVMGAIMDADDPADASAELLARLPR